LRSYDGLKSQDVGKSLDFFCVFGKTTPYGIFFQNSVPKRFIASPIDVLCSNFVKFGGQKIGKIVRYLPDKNFAWLSSSRYCVDRAKICQGQPQ